MAIFFYYVLVFLVGYACAKWYYNYKGIGCCRGVTLLNRAHIGSITFASLSIVFVKILQFLGTTAYKQQSATGNSCAALCMCCLSCCLGAIEMIIEMLNRNAVVAMSLTG